MKTLITILAMLALTGCAGMKTVSINENFNESETRERLGFGSGQRYGGKIEGEAFVNMGNGVFTCAGKPVVLFPATEYARARIEAIYDRAPSGVYYGPKAQIDVTPEKYKQLALRTVCGRNGDFSFAGVKSGEYFVLVAVPIATGPTSMYGGVLIGAENKLVQMTRLVHVSANEATKIQISN